jgi:hypothetical protein
MIRFGMNERQGGHVSLHWPDDYDDDDEKMIRSGGS